MNNACGKMMRVGMMDKGFTVLVTLILRGGYVPEKHHANQNRAYRI
jgi:hypothetical protein